MRSIHGRRTAEGGLAYEIYWNAHGYVVLYCVHARTLLEDPDRLIHILQPLVADNGKDSTNTQEKDFGRLLEQLKTVYGSRYPALEKKIEHFRYFHVVREESQYLWETLFYYVRKCLKRANVLLLSDTDYESGVANLFADELVQACKRGSLSENDIVGRLNNKSMTAAIGIVFSFVSFIHAIGFWFGYGSGNAMSRKIGEQEDAEAEILSSCLFWDFMQSAVCSCRISDNIPGRCGFPLRVREYSIFHCYSFFLQ